MVTRFNIRMLASWLLFWGLLISSNFQYAYAAPVSVKINPAIAVKDEPVVLTISIDSDSLASPDFSVLEKDFNILKKANTSSIHNEKGVTLIRKNWVLTLLPLKKGRLTIPSIKVGNERTTPLSLQVTDSKSNSPIKAVEANKDIFVKVETDIQEVYVQSQVVLTQKIYHSLPLESARLSPPVIKDDAAEVVALEQEDPYYWRVKGKRYHVIERSYALFPKHSGSLKIEKAKFTGKIKEEKQKEEKQNDSSGSLEGSSVLLTGSSTVVRDIESSAPAITLSVEPQAASYDGDYWLPAKNITLYGNWPETLDQLETGEPVTLQLGIIADGLRAEQLPDIKLNIPETVKTYLEPVELNNNITLTGVTGVWSQKITLIPSQAEALLIPEFQLSWWNIETQRKETAKLKAKMIAVKGDAAVEEAVVEVVAEEDADSVEVSNSVTDRSKELPLIEKTVGVETNPKKPKKTVFAWDGLTYMLSLSALFLLFGYLFYRFRGKSTVPKSMKNNRMDEQDKKQHVLNSLKFACLDNNPQKVQQLLLEWAKHVAGIKPATFEGIEKASNGYLHHEIEQLSKALYGRSPAHWKGVSLWDAIKKYPYPESTQARRQSGRLQDMYP